MRYPETSVRKIGVFRALQLGDLLCAVPALRALRAAYPNAKITLIGLPWASAFVERFQRYLDRFCQFPGNPGLPEQEVSPEQTRIFTAAMQAEHFDLLLQLHGNGTIVNAMLESWAARHTTGFAPAGSDLPHGGYLSYPEGLHEVERHLSLMRHLEIPVQSGEMEFPVTTEDRQAFADLDLPLDRDRYVCIHPGSRGSWRQWPTDYFAGTGDLCAQAGYTVVLTGTAVERDLVDEVKRRMSFPAMNLSGKTTLGQLAVLIEQAKGLIANCTGVSHLAAALKTKSVIISMDGEPARWGPQNTRLHATFDWVRDPDLSKVFRGVSNLLVS